jgi:hypothetical protein
MNKSQSNTPKQVPIATYILISVAGFLISIFCVYYYLHFIQGNVSEEVSQQVFYLILILFGISASAIIFGVMNSIGVLKGEYSGAKYYLAGPAVGVVLVVLGGFYLPRNPAKRVLSVRIMNQHHLPVTNGKVTLYFSQYTRDQLIDNTGLAIFSDINPDDLHDKIKLDIRSDGYSRLVFDTLLTNPAPIQVTLAETKLVHISGKVTDANEMPISDVVIMVDGTKFFGKSITDGSYSFDIMDFSPGDAIDLVSSNKLYKDKTRNLKIDRQDMEHIDFVLQPLKH